MTNEEDLRLRTRHTMVTSKGIGYNEGSTGNLLSQAFQARNLVWHEHASKQLDDALFCCNADDYDTVERTVYTPPDCDNIHAYLDWIVILTAVWSFERYDNLDLGPNSEGGLTISLDPVVYKAHRRARSDADEAELMDRRAEADKK